jgi:hypothetical protein
MVICLELFASLLFFPFIGREGSPMPCFRVAYEGKEFQLGVTIVIAPWDGSEEKEKGRGEMHV